MNARHHRWMMLLLTAALLAPLSVRPAVAADDEEPKTISDYMGIINDQYKQLRRSARKKDFNEESIDQVQKMIAAAKVCRDMVPPMAEKLKGDEKEKFIEGYKKEMDATIAEFVKLDTALKEKKNDEAAEIIDGLAALKKSGHDKYVEE